MLFIRRMRPAALLAIAICAHAQQPRFDVQSRMVLVPTTVTDARGKTVDGLDAPDFVVLDNGKPQSAIVDTIDTGVAPIALVIAVQSSGISAAAVEKVQRIGSMIQPLVTGERGAAAVLSFDQKITWLQDFTNVGALVDRAFHQLHPLTRPGEDKEARMLDAAQDAIERLRARPNARRVLLLISESRDRGSETPLDTVMLAAQTAGVSVYAATYSAFKTAFTSKAPVTTPRRPIKPRVPLDETGEPNGIPPGRNNPFPKKPPGEQQIDVLGGIGELKRLGKENAAEALTKATGGAVFAFTKQKALEEAIQKFGAELHTQYVISFAPQAGAPGYHQIEVRLAREGDYHVRARPGYWAAETR
jgi:VWFA-related protein